MYLEPQWNLESPISLSYTESNSFPEKLTDYCFDSKGVYWFSANSKFGYLIPWHMIRSIRFDRTDGK